MIVREIKKDPFKVLACFDWFNDYKDTRSWCVMMELPDLIAKLDEGYKIWMDAYNEEIKKKYGKKT